jgi:hypothetical protein
MSQKRGRKPPPEMYPEKVRLALRREFTVFFEHMITEEHGWPAISNQQFVEALADAVLAVGQKTNMGVAMLQMLSYELQDRELART